MQHATHARPDARPCTLTAYRVRTGSPYHGYGYGYIHIHKKYTYQPRILHHPYVPHTPTRLGHKPWA
eukprot:scaffold7752_cov101-Isochrysis_galbana.AAC.5